MATAKSAQIVPSHACAHEQNFMSVPAPESIRWSEKPLLKILFTDLVWKKNTISRQKSTA
jgi:hypothetical protein